MSTPATGSRRVDDGVGQTRHQPRPSPTAGRTAAPWRALTDNDTVGLRAGRGRPGRGDALVAAQLVLLLALLLPGDGASSRGRRVIGGVLLAAGGGLALLGAGTLWPALTPSPLPVPGAPLRTIGPYGWVRHPIYAGLTLAAAGRALATGVPRHRAAAVALAVLLRGKARYEERQLTDAVPQYAAYAARTPAWWPRRGGGRRCGR